MKTSKKSICLLFALFISIFSTFATDFFLGKFGKGEFVLQGKILNKPPNLKRLGFTISDYYLGERKNINIQPDGSFISSFPVVDIQDVKLDLLGETICFFTYLRDTITFIVDANDSFNTLSIRGISEIRTKELELNLLLSRKYDYLSFFIANQVSEQERISEFTNRFNEYLEDILSFTTTNGDLPSARKLIEDIYYAMADEACRINLPLAFLPYSNPYDSISRPYEKLDYNTFRYSNKYRYFLDHYFLKDRYYEVDGTDDSFAWVPDIKRIYYSCLAFLPIEPIRDWLITRRINYYFSAGYFSDVESVYSDFKKINKNSEYAQLLEERYQATLPLHANSLAPDFELEDINGNKVRLSDFRGKIVYIDFWGVYCAPCIAEFKEAVPRLKEKYKDVDIAYLYICTDSNRDQWKKAVEKYGINGVHLFAEKRSEVRQLYNVQGIPHYVLINKKGEFEGRNSLRPSQILHASKSKFDQLANESD